MQIQAKSVKYVQKNRVVDPAPDLTGVWIRIGNTNPGARKKEHAKKKKSCLILF
jgi:hypothetical protein